MPEYLAPGVYVEEVERGAAPLAGVSTSTAGFLGPTERGPTEPRLITSFADYQRTYGDHLDLQDSYLAHAVEGFFANGGSRCFVGRIASDDDDPAEATIPLGRPHDDRLAPLVAVDETDHDFEEVDHGSDATETVTVSHAGEEGDDIDVVLDDHATVETTLADDTGFSIAWNDDTDAGDAQTLEAGEAGADLDITFEPQTDVWHHWARITIDPGGDIKPITVTVTGLNADESDDNILDVDEEALDFGILEVDEEVTENVKIKHREGDSIDIDDDGSKIIGPDAGDFTIDGSGNASVDDSDSSATFDVTFAPDDPTGRKQATLLVHHDGDNAPLVVPLAGWYGEAMSVDAAGPGTWGNHVAIVLDDATMYEPGENELFKLTVRYWRDEDDRDDAKKYDADPEHQDVPDPDVEEVYDDLSPDEASTAYFVNQIDGVSMLVEPTNENGGRPATDAGPIWLDGGTDHDLDREDFEGETSDPPEKRTGLAGFRTVDDIAIVCIPDEHQYGVTDLLVTHCESMDDRFAIMQATENPGAVADLSPTENTDMGAFYYPWVEIIDPNTGMTASVPPGGHVAGIYARTDANRGVHKAPANEVVRGIQSLQRTITRGEQEILNPRGVNCIRAFRGRGIRVWGARTAASNPNWRYINVRRLFLFLRESIEEGTQWVVFEPNNEQLWSRVTQTITNFLTGVWEDGALMGTSPEEAFFVKCDRSTMTQSDIEQGRLICEIGVAPTRPAEFVVFRISQWTADGG